MAVLGKFQCAVQNYLSLSRIKPGVGVVSALVQSRLVGLAMRSADGHLLTAAELKRTRREVRAALTR